MRSLAFPCLLMLLTACQSTPTMEDPAAAIHKRVLTLDAHVDIEIPGAESRYVGDDGRSKVAPDKMRAGGLDAVVMAIAVGPGPRTAEGDAEARQIADRELAAQLAIIADPANNLVLARTAAEVRAAHTSGQGAVILALQNARILGNDVDAIDHFHDEGVRVFALTHMGHNAWADSSRPTFDAQRGQHEVAEEHGGLSALGEAAIGRINDLGGIVDVSQLSRNATREAIRISRTPVIASHSNVQALTDVSRNLSDEEIDLIGATGGVIHVAPFRGYLFDSADEALDTAIRAARRKAGIKEDYLYPFELYWELDDKAVQAEFLATVSDLLGPGSVDDMLDHLDYIVQRIGIQHVGIGTDFNHGSGVAGYQDAAQAINVTRGLVARGYTESEIAMIWGENFLRVMALVEANARED